MPDQTDNKLSLPYEAIMTTSSLSTIPNQSDENILDNLLSINDAASTDLLTEIVKEDTEIDLRLAHCMKTGQPVSRLDEKQLEQLIKFHDAKTLKELAPLMDLATTYSPVWKSITPDNLTKLQEIDPKGFYCYCLGLITINHHMRYGAARTINDKNKQETAKGWLSIDRQKQFHNSIVKAWYATSQLDEAEIKKANIHLRTFIMLDIHRSAFYTLPWHNAIEPKAKPPIDRTIGRIEHPKLDTGENVPGNVYFAYPIKKIIDGELHVTTGKILPNYAGMMVTTKVHKSGFKPDYSPNVSLFPDIDPVWPHELALPFGLNWINSHIGELLNKVINKIADDKQYLDRFHINSAFRRGKQFNSTQDELEFLLRDTPTNYVRKDKKAINMQFAEMKREASGVKIVQSQGPVKFNFKTVQAAQKPQPTGMTTAQAIGTFKFKLNLGGK